MTATEIRRRCPTLQDLLVLLRSPTARDYDGPVLTEREWTRLPTYGGREPRSTSGVWSWDAGGLLVGTCAEDVRIEPRPTCRGTWDATEIRDGHRVHVTRFCDRTADTTGCADGLCPAHTQQTRRRGPTRPIRTPAAARIGVRLSAAALAALGPRPAERAREVIEAWAQAPRG